MRKSSQNSEARIARAFKRYNEQVEAERAATTRIRTRQLWEMGVDAAAQELNQSCDYCGSLKIPQFIYGYAERLTIIWPDCNCEQSRMSAEQLAESKRLADLDAQMQLYQARLDQAGLIGWLGKATFDNYQPRDDFPAGIEHKKAIVEYTQKFLSGEFDNGVFHPSGEMDLEQAIQEYNKRKTINNWLILCGNFGNGKSHLAAAIVKSIIDAGTQNVYFRVWPEYLERLKATFNKDESSEQTQAQIIAELRTGDLVVIDDLDKSQPTEWMRTILYTAINYRYNEGLPTVLTFNYSPSDASPKVPGRLALEDYLGRSVIDRIIEVSTLIEFSGPSYRSGLDWSA